MLFLLNDPADSHLVLVSAAVAVAVDNLSANDDGDLLLHAHPAIAVGKRGQTLMSAILAWSADASGWAKGVKP